MKDVGQARVENFTDVFIVESVKHLAAFAARFHEVRRTQDSQLVAHHGLFEPERVGNIVHRNVVFHQELDDADSRRIAENAEEFREISEQRETMLKKELSLLVNKTLKNKGIEPLKTKIDMDIDDESGISIIKAEITLKKADSYKVQKVKNILKNDLSIDAKVITE